MTHPLPTNPDAPWHRPWHRLLLLAVLLGLLFRTAQWLSDHPIWHDEWMLFHNIQTKAAPQLMGPLDMNQGAPPLYLLTLRALYVTFGPSEVALRLPAYLAGCAALLLLVPIARRIIPGPGAFFAVAVMAFSDRMIWHAAEIKPYSIDVLVTLCLIAAALFLAGTARVLTLAAIAVVGMWVSYATPFAFAGVMLAMAPDPRVDRRGTLRWLACCAAAGASFLAVYFLVARHQRTAQLDAAWVHEYVPWSTFWTIPFWFARRTLELCGYAAENLGLIFLVLAPIGFVALWRAGRKREAGLLLWPAAVVLAASAIPKYPYGGSRATLFLIPPIFILAGIGIESLRHLRTPHRHARFRGALLAVRGFWWLPIPVVLGMMLVPAVYRVFVPRMRTTIIKPLAQYVQQHRQPDDPIYVASRDGYPAEFISYWGDRGGEVRGRDSRRAAPPSDWRRFWFVAITRSPTELESWQDEIGVDQRRLVERDRFDLKGASVILYEAPPPMATSATTTTSPATAPGQ